MQDKTAGAQAHTNPFTRVVFAGGGSRCWWQAGFWNAVQAPLNLRPHAIATVSAGAATACMLFANDCEWVLDYYARTLAHNKSNLHWKNIGVRGAPVFPHNVIYRQALRDILGGAHFEKLKTAPNIFIQYARLPQGFETGVKPYLAVAAGIVGYNLEKYGKQPCTLVQGVLWAFAQKSCARKIAPHSMIWCL